jgi:hypothetical protein
LVVKAPSPLLGFNNNVRHKGRVFHIQTEDSGVRHPHIITHLFADGGRILKTTKTSYAEHVGATSLADTVRGMMKEQHKAMFIALRDGQLDHLFEDLPPPAAPSGSGGGAPAAAKSVPRAEATDENGAAAHDAVPESAVVAMATPVAAPQASPSPEAAPLEHASTQPPPPGADAPKQAIPRAPSAPEVGVAAPNAAPGPASQKRSNSRPRLEIDPAALLAPRTSPLAPTMAMEAPIVAEQTIDLDLDALERAAAEAQTSFFQAVPDLPPPPAAVLGKKPSAGPAGSYSVTGAPARAVGGQGLPPGAGRYAPSRPAAIFATTRPQEGASIFGEDLISEKSLDEVILSYLAEDLDGPGEKK